MTSWRPRAGRSVAAWLEFLSSARVCVGALMGWLCVVSTAAATAPPVRGAQALQLAVRALVEGRFDDVVQITDELDARDPGVVALRARAAIARGRYAEAESALKVVVGRAPAGDAALALGLLQQMLGRRDATATLEVVAASGEEADSAADLARSARAMRALGRFQEANAAYRDAAAAAPGDPEINTGWGELFLEKYNKPDAIESFQAALQNDQKWVPAIVGLARALADDNPPQAVELATRALALNPSSVDAQLVLASQAIDAGHRDEAHDRLKKALAVNPSSLDAHALLAGLLYVEDEPADFQAEVARTLAIAPSFGEVYRVAGEMAARNYRFDEAVALTKRAIAIDANDPRSLAALGVDLLRTGDEPAARDALDASFTLDAYDLVTYNLLELMDTLQTFTTVRDGDLIVRLHKDEAPVLQDYALALARQALTTLAARYEFTPKGPILIEIFPRHDDFAVRNVGLPGLIGALGACFGRVVTMDSPKAVRPPGSFQWEATLWHELAHVVTLQMSNQRVPRWLTEGISVYEERRARPEWARSMEVEFAERLDRGGALDLRDLNAGFTDPKTVSLAYYEASLLVDHLVTAYGDAGLRRLLRAYGQGLDTESALETALNTDFDQLQAGFDQSLERVFGNWRRALAGPGDTELSATPMTALRVLAAEQARSYRVQMALGRALRRTGDLDGAAEAFQRAVGLVPVAHGAESPHAMLAAIALERKDRPRAIAELQALLGVDFANVQAARQLAGLLKASGVEDPARLRPVYERIIALDPYDADAHRTLGQLAMDRGDLDAAAREFRAVLALGPVDAAAAHTDLAECYWRAGRRPEAKKQTMAALEIAPTYERAQELLLKIVDGPR